MEKPEILILKFTKEIPSQKLDSIKFIETNFHQALKKLTSHSYKPISFYSIKNDK